MSAELATLVHPSETLQVSARAITHNCHLFGANPLLTASPYLLQSSVSLPAFRTFVSFLEDETPPITTELFPELLQLCAEFDFPILSERLSEFRNSPAFAKAAPPEDFHAHLRLTTLEDRVYRSEASLSKLRVDFAAVLERLSRLESKNAKKRPHVRERSIDSSIVSNFPTLFADFREKKFSLLWRGSRDGFRARDFHERCDRHANTLTIILDTNNNIFGGFTPVVWESRKWNGTFGSDNNCRKADESLKSFIFTIRNPHNVPARKFALRKERKNEAIECDGEWGPHFGDISIFDGCNAHPNNEASGFGSIYINDTGIGGDAGESTFFAGANTFQVKEIEVFEIRG
jgi:hypothetical protein